LKGVEEVKRLKGFEKEFYIGGRLFKVAGFLLPRLRFFVRLFSEVRHILARIWKDTTENSEKR